VVVVSYYPVAEPWYLWYCSTKKYHELHVTGTMYIWHCSAAAAVPWYCPTVLQVCVDCSSHGDILHARCTHSSQELSCEYPHTLLLGSGLGLSEFICSYWMFLLEWKVNDLHLVYTRSVNKAI